MRLMLVTSNTMGVFFVQIKLITLSIIIHTLIRVAIMTLYFYDKREY